MLIAWARHAYRPIAKKVRLRWSLQVICVRADNAQWLGYTVLFSATKYSLFCVVLGATSLNYLHMALLPVLTSMFDHLGRNGFGSDLLGTWNRKPISTVIKALISL